MTTGLLLSKPFSDRKPVDRAETFAVGMERWQRELLWRSHLEQDGELDVREVTLSETVMARDAMDICHVCGEPVTWVDHLPPRDPGGGVRCLSNVRRLNMDVTIDDIFRRVR